MAPPPLLATAPSSSVTAAADDDDEHHPDDVDADAFASSCNDDDDNDNEPDRKKAKSDNTSSDEDGNAIIYNNESNDDDNDNNDDSNNDDEDSDDDGAELDREDGNAIIYSNESKDDDDDDDIDDDDNNDEDNDDDGAELDQIEIEIDDDDDNGNTTEIYEMLAAASSLGIPLEWVIEQARRSGIDLEMGDFEEEEEIEYPFAALPTSLKGVADFIKSDKCQSIMILAGAGMSVVSGIPDFRSSNGLYATMNPDLLTATPLERDAMRMDPTAALEQTLFLENPLPCLELNREFILGTRDQRWKATLAHRFVELLHAKTGKLNRLYTQNIDGLEDQCVRLPREKVIAVHGSMDRAECARCHSQMDFRSFCDKVQRNIKDISGKDVTAPPESTAIDCPVCGYNAMKPAIVLFRSSLPKEFFEKVPEDVKKVDLLIVVGTSLRVAPANSLVWRVPKSAMRVLINREEEGRHLGMNFGDEEEEATRDFFAEGNCEDVILELMEHLGWLEDLRPLLDNEQLPKTSAEMLRRRIERQSTIEEEKATIVST